MSGVTVDPFDPTPMYLQLAAVLRDRIDRGDLAPRQMLPSEKTLQEEYGVARGTVRRAVEVLRAEGRVVTLPQRGSYVAPLDDRSR